MSWRILKTFIVEIYDEMFKLVVANLFWVLLCIPVITIPAASLAMYEFVHRILMRDDPEYGFIWKSFLKWFWRSFPIAAILILSIVIPLIGMYFYMGLSAQYGAVGYLLFALSFWLFVFILLCQIYFVPLLVHQNIPILKAIKRSALLVMLQPLASIVVLLILAILWAALIFPPYGLFLFASAVTMLKSSALLIGLGDYEQ